MKKCPAQNKLLVLHLMSASSDPMNLEGTADGVADLVRDELKLKDDSDPSDDQNLLVLLASEPGKSRFGRSRSAGRCSAISLTARRLPTPRPTPTTTTISVSRS